MIRPTTLNGAKDILLQYGNEYCILEYFMDSKQGYWLVEIKDMEKCLLRNKDEIDKYKPPSCSCVCTCTGDYICDHCKWCTDGEEFYIVVFTPDAIAEIPEFIMLDLIDEGFVVKSMSDKEYQVQTALGTAPAHRHYLITKEAA